MIPSGLSIKTRVLAKLLSKLVFLLFLPSLPTTFFSCQALSFVNFIYNQLLFREEESAWVYFKPLHQKSLHGHISDGNFDVVSQKGRTLLIHQRLNNIKTLFVSAALKFSCGHSKSIVSVDVADGGLGVSASSENELHVWETKTGEVRRELKGHLFDVYSCRLFPSGVVVLSGGADMQIKIWDAATGLCPVTLKGHTAPVTDIAIVDRGKNIISVSKDATARLWNCSESKCLATLVKVESQINCCDVIEAENVISFPEDGEMADELEFGTKGKVLAFGCEDGKVYLMSVRGREILAVHFLTSPVLCLCWLPSFHLIIGCEDGQVLILNVKEMNQMPQLLSHDSASGVLCIRALRKGFILGRKDGLCQYYSLDGSSPVQLTGPNCDPIYSIAVDSSFVYTACRDAFIRKYIIQEMELND